MCEQRTKAEIRDEILKRLEFAVQRDIEKGGYDISIAGLRSTTDIANYLYPKIAVGKVSRILNELCLDGQIDWYGKIEGLGNVSFWRLAESAGDDGDGEPVVIELWLGQDRCMKRAGTNCDAVEVDGDFDSLFPIAA